MGVLKGSRGISNRPANPSYTSTRLRSYQFVVGAHSGMQDRTPPHLSQLSHSVLACKFQVHDIAQIDDADLPPAAISRDDNNRTRSCPAAGPLAVDTVYQNRTCGNIAIVLQ